MAGRVWMVLGALFAAAGVALGAYEAHGLPGWLKQAGIPPDEIAHRLANAETAVRYQMYHALALVIVGSLLLRRCSKLLVAACLLLTGGIVCFSGGLYVFVFSGNVIHWAIVPSGGVMLIAGWLVSAIGLALARTETAQK